MGEALKGGAARSARESGKRQAGGEAGRAGNCGWWSFVGGRVRFGFGPLARLR